MDYVFINKTHTIVGLLLFFSLKEAVDIHENRPKIFLEFSVIYLCVFLFFCANVFFPDIWQNYFYVIPYVYLTKWVPYWHNAYQSRGISLVYAAKAMNDLDTTAQLQVEKLLKLEKFFLTCLVAGAFITPDVGYSYLFKTITLPSFFFELGIALQIFALAFLMPISFKVSKLIKNEKKFIFDLRYLIYPFASVSLVAFIAIRVTHGFEYFFTMNHVFKFSETKKSLKSILKFAMPTIMIVYACFFLGREIEKFITGTYTLVGMICFNLALTINIIHFHFDSKLFQMKNKKVKSGIGQLLISEKAS